MLIDDDASTNLYHEIIITEENLVEELVICSSVDEAIQLLRNMQSPPNLIFLDMNMPLKNAWDFLKEYEEKNLSANSKIIILSTTKNPDDVLKATDNPLVSEFLTKPLSVDFIKSQMN